MVWSKQTHSPIHMCIECLFVLLWCHYVAFSGSLFQDNLILVLVFGFDSQIVRFLKLPWCQLPINGHDVVVFNVFIGTFIYMWKGCLRIVIFTRLNAMALSDIKSYLVPKQMWIQSVFVCSWFVVFSLNLSVLVCLFCTMATGFI